MIKIGIFFKNSSYGGVDCSSPLDGNPGIGGREYMNLLIATSLKQFNENIDVKFYCENNELSPSILAGVKVLDLYDAFREASSDGVDYFITDVTLNLNNINQLIQYAEKYNLKIIIRMGLLPSPSILRRLNSSPIIVRVIAVEHETSEILRDHQIIRKMSVVRNGISMVPYLNIEQSQKNGQEIVYLGSLVPQKGFERLAKCWPKVLLKFPNARLHVIGSGLLYDRSKLMGKWGVASEDFERKVIRKYLSSEDGSVHPSILFHGSMGREKVEIFKKCIVGVANPTGQTETFCISAVEMQAAGLPVIAGANIAFHDNIVGESGVLVTSDSEFLNALINVLSDKTRLLRMSKAAKAYAKARYDFKTIAAEWASLIQLLHAEVEVPYPRKKNISNSSLARIARIFEILKKYHLIPNRFISSYSVYYYSQVIYRKIFKIIKNWNLQ